MIGKLNHIAIAVPNIKEAAEQYKNIFGAKVSDPVAVSTVHTSCCRTDQGRPGIW